MAGRTGLVIWLAVFAVCCAAHAQQSIKTDFTVGLDGKYAEESWNATSVRVQNPGATFPARIQLSVHEYSWMGSGSAPASIHSRDVLVPTGSSSFDCPILMTGYVGRVRACLLADGVELASKERVGYELGESTYGLHLFITTRPQELAFAREASGGVVLLEPAQVPTDARIYDSARCVVLDDVGLGDIPAPARRAILQRVHTGGTLVLTAPFLRRNAGSPQIEALTRAHCSGPTLFPDTNALCSAVAPEAKARVVAGNALLCSLPAARVAAAAAGIPLVFERHMGAGALRALATDPRWLLYADLTDELGFTREFWKRALGGAGGCLFNNRELPGSLVPEEARAKELGRPLLVLLVVFVLVMGPVNYLVLARLRRKELLIFTAPAAVVVFLIAAAVLSLVIHSRRPALMDQTVNVSSAGSDAVGTFRLFGIMAPRTAMHRLLFDRPDPLLAELPRPGFGHKRTGPVHVNEGLRAAVTDFAVTRWSLRALSQRCLYEGDAVDGSLQVGEDGLTGSVRNGLPVALEDCHLVHKWNHVAVGEIASGGGAELSLPLGPPDVSDYVLAKLPFLELPESYLDDALWGRKLTGRRWELARAAMAQIAYCVNEPMLIGWGRGLAPGPRIDLADHLRQEEHLYIIRLPVAARRPDVSVPVGGSLATRGEGWTRWLQSRSEEEEDGSDVWRVLSMEYLLPLGGGSVRHRSLEIKGRFREEPGAGFLPQARLEVYDWDRRDWHTVTEAVEADFSHALTEPDRFILMPHAVVRVRLVAGAGEMSYRIRSGLVWMDVAYRGEVVGP